MGVDFYSCKYCGDTFPDCGDYVSCDCGEHWCSDDCAEADGYTRESCKLGYDIDDTECEESCYCCDNHLESSCSYCRHEDYDNETLLDYALDLLGITREKLIEKYNEYTRKEVNK